MIRRHALLALATFGLAIGQASAADLPRKAPAYIPPAPPPITWTGCYIGANIGGAFGDASATFNFGEVSTNGSGFAGGGQIGCDYQFAGTGWVIGFRNMFDGTSNKRSGTFGSGPLAGTVVNFNNQWFDTLTGRLGYAVAPTWLLYFQGGAAWVIPVQMRPLVVFKLASSPPPEQAGQLVVALNGCSRRTGRRFWKGIGWTSAVPQGPWSPQLSLPVRVGVPGAPKRPRPLSWSA